MPPAVRLRDGIEVELADGQTIICDGPGAGDHTVVSHAHGDHLVDDAEAIVASALTATLAGLRQEKTPTAVEHPTIELYKAGHIAGSRAARITDPTTGRDYLYTGDCCPRDRFYLDGFEPPAADVLIIETTYGKPQYTFPPTATVVDRMVDWLQETMDEVVILFGYALGRAQKLQRVLARSPRETIYVTDAIATLNTAIEAACDITFPVQQYDTDTELTPGDALVVPMQTTRLNWVQSLVDTHDAVTAGVSGWAVDESFIYRRGVDEGFVLSDHADFAELVDIVTTVDPERVYTCHGAVDTFADYLTHHHGYETRALKPDQSTLADF